MNSETAKLIKTFALSALVVGMMTASTESSAATTNWFNMSAASCRTDDDVYWNFNTMLRPSSGGGGLENPSGEPAYLSCAVQDSSAFKKQHTTMLNVWVYDGSATQGVSARVCVADFSNSSGACGNIVSTSASGTGATNLMPPYSGVFPTTGTDYFKFGYIWVALPAKDVQSYYGSKINGIYQGVTTP